MTAAAEKSVRAFLFTLSGSSDGRSRDGLLFVMFPRPGMDGFPTSLGGTAFQLIENETHSQCS